MDQFDRLGLETEALKAQMSDLDRMAESLGNRLVTAFAGAALQGRNLQDVLRGLALSLSRMALGQALRPLGNLIGSGIGKVMPFADGGIVNSPVLFPMGGATGLMGEAGPEAIMPLARGPDGKLGVRGRAGAGECDGEHRRAGRGLLPALPVAGRSTDHQGRRARPEEPLR
jgi:phage-related minor tail protein